MFTIGVCLYEDSSSFCFFRCFRNQTISAARQGLAFYVGEINVTEQPKRLDDI